MLIEDFNTIAKLIIRREEVTNPENTSKKIVTFYQQIYSDFEMWRPQGLIGNCPKVDNEDNVMLKGPFEAQ